MKRKSTSQSAFFNLRVLIGLFVFLSGVFLALLSFGFFSSAKAQSPKTGNANARAVAVAGALTPVVAKSFNGDVRNLRPVRAKQDERDWEERLILPPLPVGPESKTAQLPPTIPAGPMPTPIQNFEGVARLDVVTGGQAGTGFPPDTNGEVGLNHYILAVNAAYAIYDKATGTQVAAFTENSLFSGGPTGTLCDTDSFGDPVVVYDQLANRWILTNFAFVSFPGPGPNCGAGGTMSAATTVSHVSGPPPNNAPQPNDPGLLHNLDSLGTRIMQKVQYRKIGGAESLWVVNTVRTPAALIGPLWAQLDVTGGTIAATPVQQGIHD